MAKGAASVAFGLAHRYTFGSLGVGGPSLAPMVHPELADAAKDVSKVSFGNFASANQAAVTLKFFFAA